MTADGFKSFVMPHYRAMYRVAVSILSDAVLAEDAVQETVAGLWSNREKLVAVDNPEAFCVRAVKHRCIDMMRSFGMRVSAMSASVDETLTGATVNESQRADHRSDIELVTRLMTRLSDDQREVLKLSAFGGLSNSEISAATGLSDDNVRTLLSRARRRIKELFNKATR